MIKGDPKLHEISFKERFLFCTDRLGQSLNELVALSRVLIVTKRQTCNIHTQKGGSSNYSACFSGNRL